jgi:hypothetical protein
MSKKKLSQKEKPNMNPELEGFDIKVNSFGEIVNSFGEIISNYDIDKINEFLNKNVDDKKLRHIEDESDDAGTEEEIKKKKPKK